jgi:RNA polymerase sigma-70 factor (ECF subfamily)
MERMDLEALIARIPNGDLEALEGLYRDFHHAVYSYSRLILRDRAQAEDNAQDVFLRIWAKASTYRPGGSPKAWILGIARNCAVDRIRRDGRETGFEDLPEEVLASGERLEEHAVERIDLQEALAVLDPEDRRIVLLKAVAGLPAKDVARMVGLPPSTVHWRYRRALDRLADRLHEGG